MQKDIWMQIHEVKLWLKYWFTYGSFSKLCVCSIIINIWIIFLLLNPLLFYFMMTPLIWLGTTYPCNPPHYGLWVKLHFFTICMYKHCFLPVLLVFVMKCCIMMPCSSLCLKTIIAARFLHLYACLTCSSVHASILHPLLAHHHLWYVDVFAHCLPTFNCVTVMLMFIVFFSICIFFFSTVNIMCFCFLITLSFSPFITNKADNILCYPHVSFFRLRYIVDILLASSQCLFCLFLNSLGFSKFVFVLTWLTSKNIFFSNAVKCDKLQIMAIKSWSFTNMKLSKPSLMLHR